MERIRTSLRARLSLALALGVLLSCTADLGTGTSGANDRIQLALLVQFPSVTVDPEPISTIRVTVTVMPVGTQFSQENVSVDPNASAWDLGIEVPLSQDNDQYLVELELLNADAEVDWSGNLGPLVVAPAVAQVVHSINVVRGPLGNLSVTLLSVTGPASVFEGESFSLTPNVQATAATSDTRVFWTSLTPGVGSIDDDGSGVGLSPGTARIQAEAGLLTTVHTIQVRPVPTGVVITPETATVNARNAIIEFEAAVVDSRGDPTGDPVSFSVTDSRVLRPLGDGVFQAVGGGETTITATATETPEFSATASVTVDLSPVEVFIDPSEAVLTSIGAAATLELIGRDVGGTPIFGLGATWSSLNPSAVSVDQNGGVIGLAPGASLITAEFDGLSAEALVTVTPVVTSLTITPLEVTLAAMGETQQYAAVARDAGGTEVAGAPLAWHSENETVAAIDPAGLATATAGRGTTTITVTSGGARASATLRVMQPIDRVDVLPSSATLRVGAEVRFRAVALDALGAVVTGAEFEWASSDSRVLVMFLGGLARGNEEGEVIVTATTPDGVVGTADVTVDPALPRDSRGVVVLSNTDGNDINFLNLVAGTNTRFDCGVLSQQCSSPRNLRVNDAGTFAAVPFRHSNEVGIFDLAAPGFVQVLTHTSFDEPYALAFTSNGSELWVASKQGGGSDSGTVTVVNMASRTVVAVMNDEEFVSPEGFNILGDRAFVANRSSGTLTILSVSGRSVIRDVAVGGSPRDVVVTPTGNFAYVTTESRNVVKVRVSDGVTTVIPLTGFGRSRNLAISPDGRKVFVAMQDDYIAVIDVATDAVREIKFTGAFSTYGVAILRDGSFGFVTDESRDLVYRFDPNSEVEIIGGGFPASVGFGPRGITAH